MYQMKYTEKGIYQCYYKPNLEFTEVPLSRQSSALTINDIKIQMGLPTLLRLYFLGALITESPTNMSTILFATLSAMIC